MAVRNLTLILLAGVVSIACHSITSKQRFSNLFAEAVTKIDEYSLQAVSERQLFEAAMRGMLDSLGDNSAYISGDEYTAMEQRLRQEFGGVGMYVDVNMETDELTVTSPLPDSPAERAGIQSGDVIVRINGETTQGLDRTDAIRRMRGPAGQTLTLTIRRSADQPEFDVELTREMITTPSVLGDARSPDGRWEYFLPEDPRIAYLNIAEFSDRTADEVRSILGQIKPQLQGLILDLRTNGGGLLDQAIDVCDDFLGANAPIVEIRGRENRLVQPAYRSNPQQIIDERIPIAILVDRYTASASEIVAACLQDNHRAVVIGEQSYGKGTVQDLIPLERGRSSIKITTATYWRPSGRNIDRTLHPANANYGVEPDPGFKIALTDEEWDQVVMLRNRRQLRQFNLAPKTSPSTTPPADSANANPPQQTQPLEDEALKLAIEHLKKAIENNNST